MRSALARIVEAGGLAAALLLPLAFNPYAHVPFEPAKITLFWTLVAVMGAAWLGWRLLAPPAHQSSQAGSAPAGRLLFRAAVSYAAVVVLATAVSVDRRLSFWGAADNPRGAVTILAGVLFFLLLADVLRRPAQINRLVQVLILASVPVMVYGFVQALGLDPLPWITDSVSPVHATLGRSNFLGAYLAMVAPWTLALVALGSRYGEDACSTHGRTDGSRNDGSRYGEDAYSTNAVTGGSRHGRSRYGEDAYSTHAVTGGSRHGRSRYGEDAYSTHAVTGGSRHGRSRYGEDAYWEPSRRGSTSGAAASSSRFLIVLILQVVCLALTLARGAWLGLTVGCVVFLVLLALRWRERRLWQAAGLALLAGCSVLAAMTFVRLPAGSEQATAAGMSYPELRTESALRRSVIWQHALALVPARWPLGYGPATFEQVFSARYPPGTLYQGMDAVVDDPHNILLERFLTTGVLGLVVYAGVVAAFYGTGLALLRRSSDRRTDALVAAALASVAAYLTQALFNPDVVVLSMLFWLALAIMVALARAQD